MHSPKDVLDFWFGEPATDADALKQKMKRWFRGGPEIDREIIGTFRDDVEAAVAGKLDSWLAEPDGWLALIIVLDQFTRNVFRGDARTHSGDARAVALAIDGIENGKTRALSIDRRNFAIMPLAHAEDSACQARCVVEMRALVDDAPPALKPVYSMGIEQADKYAEIIRRFGRFPHRNVLLGRISTDEEKEFLVDWPEKQAPRGAG